MFVTAPITEKVCTCKTCPYQGHPQSIGEFYVRSGILEPTEAGHYNSHCKTCLRTANASQSHLSKGESRVETENQAMAYLRRNRIPVTTGKAFGESFVDLVAFGCVRIEVKYAELKERRGKEMLTFTATPKQKQRGFLADVVLLICGGALPTYHLFQADHPVFYMHGHVKTGIDFVPGQKEAIRQGGNRIVMTQPLMDEAQDRLELIQAALTRFCDQLAQYPS